MFAHLGQPDRTALESPPLNLVVFTLNYGALEAWAPYSGVRWRDALRAVGIEGKLTQAAQQQVTISQGAPPEARTRRGYQLTMGDGTLATLYEDVFILETRAYPGWDRYRDQLKKFLEATAQQRGASVNSLVSLRYVNALSDEKATTPLFWRDKVDPMFMGPAADNELASEFKQGLLLLTFSDGTSNAELRIGLQPDAVHAGRVAYVFDMDFGQPEEREFTIDGVLEQCDDLNTAALRVFQRVLRPEFRAELVNA